MPPERYKMTTIKHNGITFKITPKCTICSHKSEQGYLLTETNHWGQRTNFHNTIFTDDGINSMMIQRSKCYGIEMPTDKLI